MKNFKKSQMSKKKSFKKVKIRNYTYESKKSRLFNTKNIIIFSFMVFLIIIIIQFIIIYNSKTIKTTNRETVTEINIKRKYDINFIYEKYDKDIIPDKDNKISKRQMSSEEAQFINGIIRKNKLKNCLEIGVAHGGSSIVILNAIKDIENSVLVSIDLNKEVYDEPSKLTGYKVNENFPDLAKNWKLYTGDQPHKFLVDLNMKFDFALIDTVHVSPAEIINFIEVLPFLNENAIVVIHDLIWHFWYSNNNKFFPSCISLIPALFGDKVLIHRKDGDMPNMGAVFLYSNQEEHYLDYFLLLMNFWEYIPSEEQINDLRIFIQKYYKDKRYITIFNTAVRENKAANQNFKKINNEKKDGKYLAGLGHQWNLNNK